LAHIKLKRPRGNERGRILHLLFWHYHRPQGVVADEPILLIFKYNFYQEADKNCTGKIDRPVDSVCSDIIYDPKGNSILKR